MISGSGSTLFEELGLYYIGPIDGHSLDELIGVLQGKHSWPFYLYSSYVKAEDEGARHIAKQSMGLYYISPSDNPNLGDLIAILQKSNGSWPSCLHIM